MLLLPTIRVADLPCGKPQRDYLGALLPLLAGLPVRPVYRNLARFGDRFPIEFNFRDAKQHLGLAAGQALARFSMANVKLKAFLELVLARLFTWDGLDRTLRKYPEALLVLGPIEPKPT